MRSSIVLLALALVACKETTCDHQYRSILENAMVGNPEAPSVPPVADPTASTPTPLVHVSTPTTVAPQTRVPDATCTYAEFRARSPKCGFLPGARH